MSNLSNPRFQAAGGHFNPYDSDHGAPQNPKESRHVGDLGNILVKNGSASISINDSHASLYDEISGILGRAIVIHSGTDDLGLGGDEGSLKTGRVKAR